MMAFSRPVATVAAAAAAGNFGHTVSPLYLVRAV
jgi:hypothetical protein